jgi:hypothetical protein
MNACASPMPRTFLHSRWYAVWPKRWQCLEAEALSVRFTFPLSLADRAAWCVNALALCQRLVPLPCVRSGHNVLLPCKNVKDTAAQQRYQSTGDLEHAVRCAFSRVTPHMLRNMSLKSWRRIIAWWEWRSKNGQLRLVSYVVKCVIK